MEELESKTLASYYTEKLKHWRRYVEDSLAVVKASVVKEIKIRLNSRHYDIMETMEIAEEGKLPMLDVVLHAEDTLSR